MNYLELEKIALKWELEAKVAKVMLWHRKTVLCPSDQLGLHKQVKHVSYHAEMEGVWIFL